MASRRWFLKSLCGIAPIGALTSAFEARPQTRRPATENVILITADGLRHQELFGGADATILDSDQHSGSEKPSRVRDVFWRDDVSARREALMPFFWKELIPNGVVAGNRALGSKVDVSNEHLFSYPGYSEILTGRPQPSIRSNDPVPSPVETILEYTRRALDLRSTQVAAFGSWEVFDAICASRPGSIYVNSGYRPILDEIATPEMMRWSELQTQLRTPWDTVRHDVVTLALALEYLEVHRPQLLYVALGETDDWAHDQRYDRMLETAHLFDDAVRQIWTTAQSLNGYRDRTTLVITTDHGRGRTPEDWTSHGEDVEGAQEIWIAVRGPDTPPRGVLSGGSTTYQAQVAATVLALLGLDYEDYSASAAPPLDFALPVSAGE